MYTLRAALIVFSVAFLFCADAIKADTASLDCNSSVGISSYTGRLHQSNGKGVSTAIRQNQNWMGFESKTLLMSFDTAPVRGWKIDKAYLNITMARGDLYGVGLCEVLAPWNAGDGVNFEEKAGAACWAFAKLPKDVVHPAATDWWAWPGSIVASVSWAHPSARYSHAGPGQIERKKVGATQPVGSATTQPVIERFVRLRVPVDVDLVASMAAGTSYGLIMTDDKGQVAEACSVLGSGYPYIDNDAEDPYVFTRNVQDKSLRPTLEVIGVLADANKKPGGVKVLKATASADPSQQVVIEIEAPADADGKRVLAYEVTAMLGADRPLPRWMLPKPAEPGSKQRMVLWNLPAGDVGLAINAVDRAGLRGDGAAIAHVVIPPPGQAKPQVPVAATAPDEPNDFPVAIVPDAVRVDPVTGELIVDGGAYAPLPVGKVNRRIWDNQKKHVTLASLANEVVAFNIVIPKGEKGVHDVKVELPDLKADGGSIAARNLTAYRQWYMKSEASHGDEVGPGQLEDHARRPVAWHAEVCVPLAEPFPTTVSVPSPDNAIEGQTNTSLLVDVYVPKGSAAGKYAGTIRLTSPDWQNAVEVPVELSVAALALPDEPSFLIELNCYGGLAGFAGVDAKDPDVAQAEWRFYALAKQHRLMINALPYGQRGKVDSSRCPVVSGEGAKATVTDWSPFDQRYGPLLDGSAFDANKGYVGPGASKPISHMYLPFHENWPIPLQNGYGDYANLTTRLDFAEWSKTSRPLDEAFSDAYKNGYRSVARQFVEHLAAKGWTGTRYQVFFNNKYFYKVSYYSAAGGSAGSSFWLLDESVDYDDYAANRFFHELARQGAAEANRPEVKFDSRVDVSQPELTRGLFDGVVNVWMNGLGALEDGYVTTAKVRQKFIPGERYWFYGGGPGIAAAPVDTMQLLLAEWAEGAEGALPYWTTLQGKDWNKADDLAIYYTGKNYLNSGKSYPGPLPSLRMKIMRRYQQDIEMVQLLAQKNQWSRAQARMALASLADDPAANVLQFKHLTWEREEALRQWLREELSR